jgi:predicted tellurium resistance membrane protein TerC
MSGEVMIVIGFLLWFAGRLILEATQNEDHHYFCVPMQIAAAIFFGTGAIFFGIGFTKFLWSVLP